MAFDIPLVALILPVNFQYQIQWSWKCTSLLSIHLSLRERSITRPWISKAIPEGIAFTSFCLVVARVDQVVLTIFYLQLCFLSVTTPSFMSHKQASTACQLPSLNTVHIPLLREIDVNHIYAPSMTINKNYVQEPAAHTIFYYDGLPGW